jgi:hypothetical protein
MPAPTSPPKPRRVAAGIAEGRCACGEVRVEIDTPAFWAWHDHSPATRRAQGCACATYVGCWKSKVRVTQGAEHISRYEDAEAGAVRSFCALCGSPLFYERRRTGKMVNLPRALFDGRTGREPLYHRGLDEAAEWEWRGEPVSPLKGYPGVMRQRGKRKAPDGMEPGF